MIRATSRLRRPGAWLGGPVLLVLLALLACGTGAGDPPPADPLPADAPEQGTRTETAARMLDSGPPERLGYRVVAVHPHGRDAYTQGLLVHGGLVYESTGRYGHSRLRAVEPESGEVVREVALPGGMRYFGEGLARWGDRLIQLTWRSGVAFVWDLESFELLAELGYQGQGWGLAGDADGTLLYMTDGGTDLVYRDPETFAEIGRVTIERDGRPLPLVNELEWVDGVLWGNVYGSETVVRLDPDTGRVTGELDLSGLLPPEDRPGTDVLNGIAWWPERGTFLVTGKLWPKMFEITIEAPPAAGGAAGAPPPDATSTGESKS